MKTKTAIQQGTSTLKISAIRGEINQKRRKVVGDKLKVIEEENAKGKEALGAFFKDVYNIYKELDSKSDQQVILAIWKNQKDPAEKAKQLAEFLASKVETDLLVYGEKFLKLFKTDEELNLFLADPQKYIDTHKDRTAYELQILQLVINSPEFNSLPSVNRKISSGSYIYTPLTNYMYQLDLPGYASTDARRFLQCIAPSAETQVLEKADKPYNGRQVVGIGAQLSFTPKTIKQTANAVKGMKRGACHDFAQLAADQFLSLIEQGELSSSLRIKMVSHNNKLGSHTFLLIGHTSKDLNDLSDCLIVDPWSVVMGHTSTYGVYTKENYPFPEMATQLTCCYDNADPSLSKRKKTGHHNQVKSAAKQAESTPVSPPPTVSEDATLTDKCPQQTVDKKLDKTQDNETPLHSRKKRPRPRNRVEKSTNTETPIAATQAQAELAPASSLLTVREKPTETDKRPQQKVDEKLDNPPTKELLDLRETVASYRQVLTRIEEQEQRFFTERLDQALINRREALTKLEACVNTATTLTSEVRRQVGKLALEIKANKPTWAELGLLDKILDFVTLGLHALYRYSLFKPYEAEKKVEGLIEKYPSIEKDM